MAVEGLSVDFRRHGVTVPAVRDVSFDVARGETLGVVGESGCGKSATMLAALGLLPAAGQVTSGSVWFGGRDLLSMAPRQLRAIRGREVGMVFQDPMTSLHPALTVGRQVAEALRVHDRRLRREEARARAAELLAEVGIPSPLRRLDDHPHEWSGGMRQRAMLAMALANRPRLLIADEPTTALDVTVQAQVLQLLQGAQREHGMAVVVVSHDLGVIAEVADRVVVMYAGRVVETSQVTELFTRPRHPYTASLLASVPRLDRSRRSLVVLSGQPPGTAVTSGCAFEPRCPVGNGRERCARERPDLVPNGSADVACHYPSEVTVP